MIIIMRMIIMKVMTTIIVIITINIKIVTTVDMATNE